MAAISSAMEGRVYRGLVFYYVDGSTLSALKEHVFGIPHFLHLLADLNDGVATDS